MKILALDIATKTGWKTEHASGVRNFKLKRGESSGMLLIHFRKFIDEMVKTCEITLICYERAGGRHAASIAFQSEMIGILKAYCEEHGLNLTAYSAKEIKKHATDNGNAGKPLMIKKAIELGFNPTDDNEADAIHLYRLAVESLT